MGYGEKSRARINPERYKAMLRVALEAHNDLIPLPINLPEGAKRNREMRKYQRHIIGYVDLVTSRKKSATRLRWTVFAELRKEGFSLPAIGEVSGFDHTTVLYGLRVEDAERRGQRYDYLRKDRHTDIASSPPQTSTDHTARTSPVQSADILPAAPDRIL